MRVRQHLTILAQAVGAWAAFWVVGLPEYYQHWHPVVMAVACTVLSAGITLLGFFLLASVRPETRRSRALWYSFYFTVPLAILDTLYCGIYLQHGWSYLARYWYLTVFYFTPWLTFPPTALILARVGRVRRGAAQLPGAPGLSLQRSDG